VATAKSFILFESVQDGNQERDADWESVGRRPKHCQRNLNFGAEMETLLQQNKNRNTSVGDGGMCWLDETSDGEGLEKDGVFFKAV